MGAFARAFNEKGVVGYSSDMEKQNVITRIASGVTGVAATKIGFAQPVTRGVAPKTCVMWDGTNGNLLGLTLAAGWIDPAVGYANGDNVAVINEGQIWAHASGACTEGKTPMFDAATGGYKDAVTGEEDEALVNCVFNSSATAGGIVTIQVATRIA